MVKRKKKSTLCVIIEKGLDANKIQCVNSKVKTIGVVLLKLFGRIYFLRREM